jgi:hypothetical protein
VTSDLLLNLLPLVLLVTVWFLFWGRNKWTRTEAMGQSAVLYENLVPLEKYDVDETGYWSRLRWVAGLFFGTSMGILAAIGSFSGPDLYYSPSEQAVIAFVVGGPMFGLFLPIA